MASNGSTTGSERPSRCETDGCHRDPEKLLFFGLAESTLDLDDNEESWRCQPCYSALLEGNKIPGGSIEVVRRV